MYVYMYMQVCELGTTLLYTATGVFFSSFFPLRKQNTPTHTRMKHAHQELVNRIWRTQSFRQIRWKRKQKYTTKTEKITHKNGCGRKKVSSFVCNEIYLHAKMPTLGSRTHLRKLTNQNHDKSTKSSRYLVTKCNKHVCGHTRKELLYSVHFPELKHGYIKTILIKSSRKADELQVKLIS